MFQSLWVKVLGYFGLRFNILALLVYPYVPLPTLSDDNVVHNQFKAKFKAISCGCENLPDTID